MHNEVASHLNQNFLMPSDDYNQRKSPLCVFCLTPPFSIRAASRPHEGSARRRRSVHSWRRDGSSLPSIRARFKPFHRRSSNSLPKYLSGFSSGRPTLTLQEVLDEIQKVWTPQERMDERFRKSSSISSETVSPILLRRRLSAPETIMRKHMLAQQRSESQDSVTQSSETKSCQWRSEIEGSDSNLSRKRDPDLMRKSTLLRRLWSHTKPLTSNRFSGTFYEWQHSFGKLSSGKSLTSVHSSPEHIRKKNASPKHLSPKRKSSTDTRTSTTFTPKTTETSTRFTNSYTTFSDYSDSAYTNSRSNLSETSNNNNNNNQENSKTQPNEASTQTQQSTNVNVISNVHLSQSTLDVIFNQVMQDVKNSFPIDPGVEPKLITVKEMPSFYLKRKDDVVVENQQHNRIMKYMISNVGVGSHYTKPTEVPTVPRYSALPRTISMEVNISSCESTDSDSVSLVDSLEDGSSFNTDLKEEITPPLPDNSKKVSTAFYIPIEVDKEIASKAVSDHLPEKVREKLVKRQQKREEKVKSKNSSDSNYISASDNGNQYHFIVGSSDINLNSTPLPDVNYNKNKKRSKPLLPSIETFRRKEKKCFKRKPLEKNQWVPKKKGEKLTPLYSSRNEFVCDCGPRRIYHKTEFNKSNKRIEILEIMECVEPQERTRSKSKIPVLINSKSPKKPDKPVYLDFNADPSDPKLDQLIANILIETLNSQEEDKADDKNAKPSPKYQQKFEVIPEEIQEDSQNNNCEKSQEDKSSYQGKAAVALVRDENFSSIPKGWITFYMLHKNRGSPDSTSDEGKKRDKNNSARDLENVNNGAAYDVIKLEEDNKGGFSGSELQPERHRKIKQRHKSIEQEEIKEFGEWSVTVSGTNSNGNLAPNLEMSLKFPPKNCPHYDSGLGEENERPYLPTLRNTDCQTEKLPEIPGLKRMKRSDSGLPAVRNAISSRIEPRPTRTSIRRYNLSRPKIEYQMERRNINLLDERQYAEILRRLPEILSITGNTLYHERK